MSKEFDLSLKSLFEENPRALIQLAQINTTETLKILNADISHTGSSPDEVIGIGNPVKEIAQIEFQSSRDLKLILDCLTRNVLIHRKYSGRVTVSTHILLLRPLAFHKKLTGVYCYRSGKDGGPLQISYEDPDLANPLSADEKYDIIFRYHLVKLYEIPFEKFFEGPIDLVPLAILGKMPAKNRLERATEVATKIIEKVRTEAPEREADLLIKSYLLLGLYPSLMRLQHLFEESKAMRDSLTYQKIKNEGRKEAREEGRKQQLVDDILDLGTQKFGNPSEAHITFVHEIQELIVLRAFLSRILVATSWDDLLKIDPENSSS